MTIPSKKSAQPVSSQKAALKGMLKECLRELIEEGAFDHVMTMKESVMAPVSVRQAPTPSPSNNQRQQPSPDANNDFLNTFVGDVARSAASGNSKMAEMLKEAFMDTAMTTMVNQREGKGYGALDEHLPAISSSEQAKMDSEIAQIEALAGSSIHRWAQTAGIKKSQ